MIRFLSILIVLIAVLTAGCSMCCGPYDYHYPVFGGKYHRANPTYGRVGSIFSDPNALAGGPSADSNLTSLTADETDEEDGSDDLEDPDDIDRELRELRDKIDSNEGLDGVDPDELPDPDDLPGFDQLPDTDDLPDPDSLTRPDDETTASREWRQRPLRQKNWR